MKKGFTLIELMVVIVIIGILAAIAVPKMFGMSAKAKAAEVGPAAGTWSKLEQSYIVETGFTGSFTSIGYTKPTSTNFDYTEYTASTNTTGYWQAAPLFDLNKCLKTATTAANVWQATITNTAPSVPTPIAPPTDCLVLTPNFTALK